MCVCERERVTGVIDRPFVCGCGWGCVSHRHTSMRWQQRVFSLNCFVFYEKEPYICGALLLKET